MIVSPDKPIRILLVEDNADFAELIREILSGRNPSQALFHVETATSLKTAFASIDKQSPDVILLDLSLPDSAGFQTFIKTHTRVPEIPVVILTAFDDQALAVEAIRKGAQDYLVKSEVDGKVLSRVMRFAIERQRLQTELRQSSLIDDVTGLYSRRGFQMVGEQQLRLANRTKKAFLVIMVDSSLDDPQSLLDMTEILKNSYRKSDILARTDHKRFVLLAIDAPHEAIPILTQRLDEQLRVTNRNQRTEALKMTYGVTAFQPGDSCTLDNLLSRAETDLARRGGHAKS